MIPTHDTLTALVARWRFEADVPITGPRGQALDTSDYDSVLRRCADELEAAAALAVAPHLQRENDVREQVIESLVYAIEGKPLPHPALADNSIVKRALKALAVAPQPQQEQEDVTRMDKQADSIGAATAPTALAVGDIVHLSNRSVRVCGYGNKPSQNWRGCIAVRNVKTNRLTYINKKELLRWDRESATSVPAVATPVESATLDPSREKG